MTTGGRFCGEKLAEFGFAELMPRLLEIEMRFSLKSLGRIPPLPP
jgi:hypothetical protein